MSRESLLDEAIAKAKEAEDWQLAEWLRMARGGESAARWYSDKLRDENAKLREQSERLFDKTLELATDNAKLRELVKDMWRGCPVDERDCIACDFERDGMCDLFDRMRELGVEV